MVGSDTWLSRCAVNAPSGEEAVLTVTLQREKPSSARPPATAAGDGTSSSSPAAPPGTSSSQAAPPADAAPGAPGPGPSSSSSAAQPMWRVAKVTGEHRHACQLDRLVPSPEFPPEAVVQAQLLALQQYEFAKVRFPP